MIMKAEIYLFLKRPFPVSFDLVHKAKIVILSYVVALWTYFGSLGGKLISPNFQSMGSKSGVWGTHTDFKTSMQNPWRVLG